MQIRNTLGFPLLAWVVACGSDPSSTSPDQGASSGGKSPATGGAVSSTGGSKTTAGGSGTIGGSSGGTQPSTGGGGANTGGSRATGGTDNAEGGTLQSTGGRSSGGVASGGAATGGSSVTSGGSPSGGKATGGASSSGGTQSGGNSSGGASTGGSSVTSSGGVSTGGNASGGRATGGTPGTGGNATGGTPGTGGNATGGTPGTGGNATGGTATGGTATGGTGPTNTGGTGACDWSSPPSDVSAWVDESWNAQLGSNVKNLKRWILDSAMLGKGQINLCMRWGASSAPSATVKSGIAATYQKWFTAWFSQLEGYGCFPYPSITVKVTGWAVKPGNTSWVSDVDSSAKVYTETDGSGEPKCPDSCSFFSNPSHSFPSCPGGEAFHHDYWVWIDDSNAAAGEGGDWGVRAPVAALDNAFKSIAYDVNTFMHEMGHGFGFQDYYDWTGSTPAGGSLMILKDPLPTSPTLGDKWLLRRTWKECKTLRGW